MPPSSSPAPPGHALRLLLCNAGGATPTGPRGARRRAPIATADPDLACLTQATRGLLPDPGHPVAAEPDPLYLHEPHRGRLALWARHDFLDRGSTSPPGMPQGRFVWGLPKAADALLLVAVCLPPPQAHVRTGRRDRQPWQEHAAYLAALQKWLARWRLPIALAGTFGCTFPPARSQRPLQQRLLAALHPLTLRPGHPLDGFAFPLTHHLACSPSLAATAFVPLRRADAHGHLTCHPGFVCTLGPATA